jgi:hypothetical protein
VKSYSNRRRTIIASEIKAGYRKCKGAHILLVTLISLGAGAEDESADDNYENDIFLHVSGIYFTKIIQKMLDSFKRELFHAI